MAGRSDRMSTLDYTGRFSRPITDCRGVLGINSLPQRLACEAVCPTIETRNAITFEIIHLVTTCTPVLPLFAVY